MTVMLKDAPLVSVIIPVYNMELYLAETLDSIISSSYPNLEIVIVDDGSTDRSAQIATDYSGRYPFVSVHKQSNGGAIKARNKAASLARGKYLLPVDADNRIAPDFIAKAVDTIEQDPMVKVVAPSAEFIGDRKGKWNLPKFSLKLLARKNIMDTCALYAKSEWERVGGYQEEIIAREDWEFWIAVLKEGGKVVRLPETGLYYRIRKGSKRQSDRKLKKHVIKTLNKLHPEFFQLRLGGPLRMCRSWSRKLNYIYRLFCGRKMNVNSEYLHLSDFIYSLPERFETEGEYIYQGRNTLKKFEVKGVELIVKSYQRPILINRIIYGFIRPSKAERSYEYARKFLEAGIGSPAPIGYLAERNYFLLKRSYFISLKSSCNLQFTDFKKQSFVHHKEILEAIGRTTARMHESGFWHKDYSGGNILFRDEVPVPVEIIDLNRMRFHQIDMRSGCKNFERLKGSEEMFELMGTAYARERKMNEEECISLIQKFHD